MYHFWGEVGMYMLTHMGKSDNNVQELILSFHHIGSRDQTQADQLDSKYLYLLNHYTGPDFCF